jgi:hypothetical protein
MARLVLLVLLVVTAVALTARGGPLPAPPRILATG